MTSKYGDYSDFPPILCVSVFDAIIGETIEITQSGSGMRKIFDRHVTNSLQDVDTQLLQMESGESKERAIAENIRLDSRVAEARSDHFASFAQPLLSNENLATVLKDYSYFYSATQFCCPVNNRSNLLFAPRVLDEPKLSGDIIFVSVQKLFLGLRDKLAEMLREVEIAIQGADIGNSEELSVDEERSRVNQWLSSLTFPRDLDTLGEYVAEAHRRLILDDDNTTRARGAQPERICWAGRQDEFEAHRNFGLRRWMEILGLGHLVESDDWFILVEYPLGSTSAVARPTVLEAGPTEWHFPFPGELSPELGGRTMILGEAIRENISPVSEFVHNNRRIEKENVKGLFRLEPSSRFSVDLDTAREHHRNWFMSVKNQGAL